MNLAEYEKLDLSNGGEYIKFESNGETRYLRFMYESGGEKMGEDIETRRKYWDEEQHKYVYDTDQGSLQCVLKCIEYNEDGSNPRLVKWERSAYFCKTTLMPMWRNYPRIIDGVWKVTASNPKTVDATYSLFPIMNADTIKYPLIAENKPQEKPEEKKATAPAAEPAPKKKYWE